MEAQSTLLHQIPPDVFNIVCQYIDVSTMLRLRLGTFLAVYLSIFIVAARSLALPRIHHVHSVAKEFKKRLDQDLNGDRYWHHAIRNSPWCTVAPQAGVPFGTQLQDPPREPSYDERLRQKFARTI